MKKARFRPYFFLFLMAGFLTSCRNDTATKPVKEPVEATEKEIENSTDPSEKRAISNLIRVEAPKPNTEISSPLSIKGKARGTWFFEGDFPVRLFDKDSNEIAIAIATAKGEWMTEDWVDFEATLEFEAPATENGELVFQKSNPSDKRALDNEFRIPVKFK